MGNGASYVMSAEVTKVVVGAASMMSDGSVVSRAGTGALAVMAKHYGIPVIVCCETYKFSERVQIDSICNNELGDFDALVKDGEDEEKEKGGGKVLGDWRNIPKLKMLNLKYDTTPSKLINMVITELGVMPPSAAPVVIRECHKDRQLS